MPKLRPAKGRGSACCSWMGSGNLPLAAVAGLVLVLDRVTKLAVADGMPYGASRTVVDGFFNLVHWRNTGIAFSMFAESPSWFRAAALPVISTAAVVAIVVMLRKQGAVRASVRFAVALIVAGAAGNLYDRLRFGYVTDFLDFFVGSYHWPAFNVADCAITVGAGMLILDSFLDRGPADGAEGLA